MMDIPETINKLRQITGRTKFPRYGRPGATKSRAEVEATLTRICDRAGLTPVYDGELS